MNIINFTLKPESLEKQLLDLVYKIEYKDKFDEHIKKINSINKEKNDLKDYEDYILNQLITEIDFLSNKQFRDDLEKCKNSNEELKNTISLFEVQNKSFNENKQTNERVAKLGTKL